MLVTTSIALVLTVATGVWRTQIRTDRAEVHEGREGDDPEVSGVNYVTTIELESREPG